MRWATRSTRAPGSASRMKAISLEQACRNPLATDRMAQLCSVMRQPPSVELLHVGQVAVLVEDAGELGHLLVEGQAGQPGLGPGQPPLAALLEELGHLGAVGAAEIAEQFGGQVAVALGEQPFGALGASS